MGFDSTNIVLDLAQNEKIAEHACIFRDEIGQIHRVLQKAQVEKLRKMTDCQCCVNCPSIATFCEMKDSIHQSAFLFRAYNYEEHSLSSYEVEIDKFSFQINKFTDTLHNFPIQNDTFATVFRYQIDSSLVSIDSVWLKTIYFAPKKGIVKLDFKQNQFWERVN